MAKDTSNISRLITTNGDAFPRSRFLSISRPKEGGREVERDEGYSRGCSPISFLVGKMGGKIGGERSVGRISWWKETRLDSTRGNSCFAV